MKSTITFGLLGAAAALALGLWALAPQGPDPQPEGTPLAEVDLPDRLSEDAKLGKAVFEAKCSACHGENAAGRAGMGPPLVHRIYEPSHHGDESFQLAAARGVRAHHWEFGNMPPVEGITRDEVALVTRYIREVQRANGIE